MKSIRDGGRRVSEPDWRADAREFWLRDRRLKSQPADNAGLRDVLKESWKGQQIVASVAMRGLRTRGIFASVCEAEIAVATLLPDAVVVASAFDNQMVSGGAMGIYVDRASVGVIRAARPEEVDTRPALKMDADAYRSILRLAAVAGIAPSELVARLVESAEQAAQAAIVGNHE